MDEVLKDVYDICKDYMDDVIIGSSSIDKHLQDLRKIFTKIKDAGLSIRLEKCKFVQDELVYLGHLISGHGIKPDPKKTLVIKELAQPKDLPQLKRFLRITGYYRRFIKNYAKIAQPLYQLLRHDSTWI